MEINSFRGQYAFLSNFSAAKTMFEGMEYPTAEHAFQAAKALPVDKIIVFDQEVSTRAFIRDFASPTDAKRYAKTIKIRENWSGIRDSVMFIVLMSKFSVPALKAALLGTGDAQLIEGNWWHDCYWGVCGCPKCSGRPKINKLGHLLMLVRAIYAHGMENEAKLTL